MKNCEKITNKLNQREYIFSQSVKWESKSFLKEAQILLMFYASFVQLLETD